MDAAECIGCGACVAACPNASAMLFTAAKITHLNALPQGQPERDKRTFNMVAAMDREEFGSCTNHGECEAVCPKEIPLEFIAQLNRDLPPRSVPAPPRAAGYPHCRATHISGCRATSSARGPTTSRQWWRTTCKTRGRATGGKIVSVGRLQSVLRRARCRSGRFRFASTGSRGLMVGKRPRAASSIGGICG